MATAKRGKAAFSPPKPRKVTSTNKSKNSTSATSRRTSTNITKRKSDSTASNKRPRRASPTPSASASTGDSNDVDEPMSVDENEDVDEDADEENDNTHLTNQRSDDSPEPDFILAEISHDSGSTGPTIPIGLIHRILHSQFAQPEKTKISTDARDLMGKYIDVFVREAIARCAFEKTGEENDNSPTQQGDGGGWLEVDDLEKVAVQLCLDF